MLARYTCMSLGKTFPASKLSLKASCPQLSSTVFKPGIRHMSSLTQQGEGNQGVWNDLDSLNDFYDPNYDWGLGGEEGNDEFGEEEYNQLLKHMQNENSSRFNARDYRKVDESLRSTSKVTSIEGDSALDRFRIGTLNVPSELVLRIRAILKGYPRDKLVRDARNLSDSLRARTVEQVTGRRLRRVARNSIGKTEDELSSINIDKSTIEYNKQQAFAYIAHRVPGIYACNTRVFDEIKKRCPYFMPISMLDFGSGPGTTIWSSSRVWPTLKKFTAVEPSESMNTLSESILDGFDVERRLFLHHGQRLKYDLVVASYSLSELIHDESRKLHVMNLWGHVSTGGLMVLIEPGTPVGFKIMRKVRTMLLEMKDYEEQEDCKPMVVGPCTHESRCPMDQTTWCHFVQRVQRSSLLRSTKKVTQDWENEKFSYLAISKGPIKLFELPKNHLNKNLAPSRLVRQPLKRGGHVILDVCQSNGLLDRRIISKKHGKDIYHAARKATWGDLFYFDRVPTGPSKKRNWKGRFSKPQERKKSIPKDGFVEKVVDGKVESALMDFFKLQGKS